MVCRTTISGTFETGQIALRIYLTEREGSSAARLQLFLPVGLYMRPGVKLTVDKGTAYKIPFTWCLTNTCIAGDLAAPALLREMEAGKTLAVEVVDTNLLAVTTSLPLRPISLPSARVRRRRSLNRRLTSDVACRTLCDSRCFFNRLDQRLRREWLRQIGKAARGQCRHPGGVAVISGDVDDRQG